MRPTKYAIVLVMLSLFVFSISIAHADEPEKIEKVIVSGVGIDMDKAKQNAIRNAVEQVIGSYISSDIIIQNDSILKYEILNFSGGYVKDMKVVSQEKNNDGLYSVKIEANVISTTLKRKLESLNIATKKIEGESLFGEAVSKIENQKTGQELLDKILSKYPQAAYIFEIGKPQIMSTDPGTGEAKVSIPLTIQWDKNFISELKDVLSKLATVELKSPDIISLDDGEDFRKYGIGNKIICFSGKKILRSGNPDVCEVIGILGKEDTDRKKGKSEQDKSANPNDGTRVKFDSKSILNLAQYYVDKKMSLTLKFKDKFGADIDAATYIFNHPRDNDGPGKQGMQYNRNTELYNRLAQNGDGGFGFVPPNTLWSKSRHILILTDGVFKINPEVNIDVNILKSIENIEVHMNSWKRD